MNVKAMVRGLAWDVGLPVALVAWNARYVARARAAAARA
jgi:hypothetical protein